MTAPVETEFVSPTPKTEFRMSADGVGMTYRSAKGTEREVLRGITFDVRPGEFVSIVGPSGAGKTTLLRCLAGLLAPTAGQVRFDGEIVSAPPEKLALVFQDYSRSLMPWLTIEKNIELPLLSKGLSAAERREASRSALHAVGLVDVEDSYPWQLSGGMQQRVAIARAIAYQPEALLMDEPFASVDAQTRADLEDLVLRIRTEFGMTMIAVTHDIDESVYLSDRVVVVSGRPAHVSEVVDVDLGPDRDQFRTKSEPEFLNLRNRVMKAVRRPTA